jgi:hypothetical protein
MIDDSELRRILQGLPITWRAAFAYRCACRVRGFSKPSLVPSWTVTVSTIALI